jgi:Uma2 family endonuclease
VATHPKRIRFAEEVLQLPRPPGVSGYELVDGEPVPVTPVGPTHGHLAIVIGARLYAHVKQRNIGGRVYADAGYVLGLPHDPERLRAPDVSFVRQDKLAGHTIRPTRVFFRLAPDLAIEIESPQGDTSPQRIQDFLDAGTRLIWVIRPLSRSATVYRADRSTTLLREPESLDGEDVIPGLRIALAELFDA